MVLADSSVWIDYFGNVINAMVERLDGLVGRRQVLTGDLVLAEVLQGVRSDREFRIVRDALLTLDVVQLTSPALAIKSAPASLPALAASHSGQARWARLVGARLRATCASDGRKRPPTRTPAGSSAAS